VCEDLGFHRELIDKPQPDVVAVPLAEIIQLSDALPEADSLSLFHPQLEPAQMEDEDGLDEASQLPIGQVRWESLYGWPLLCPAPAGEPTYAIT
jgi:hypothetical protein